MKLIEVLITFIVIFVVFLAGTLIMLLISFLVQKEKVQANKGETTLTNTLYLESSIMEDDDIDLILAEKHAVYVEARYQLLKELYQADSTSFKQYAQLVFWELNSVFPDNLIYRNKIEKLEEEDINVALYLKKEREAWGEYKKIEGKYR